jgi:hypothetical protein
MMGLLALVSLAAAQDVQVSGRVHFSSAGPVRVEALSLDDAGQPLLVAVALLDAPGDYSLVLPANCGPIIVRAGLDLDGDGLGPNDPYGRHAATLEIARADVSDVDVTLRPAGARRPGDPTD